MKLTVPLLLAFTQGAPSFAEEIPTMRLVPGDTPPAALEGEPDRTRLPGLYFGYRLQDRGGDIGQEPNSDIIQPGGKFFMGDNCGVEPPPSV